MLFWALLVYKRMLLKNMITKLKSVMKLMITIQLKMKMKIPTN